MRQFLGLTLLAGLSLTACQGGSDGLAIDSNPNTSAGASTTLPPAPCERSSWVAGTTELCGGKLIYRDYVYDDYGADLGFIAPPATLLNLGTRLGPGQTQPGPLSPSAGDQQYPAGLENTADLVKLTVAIEGPELVATFELNTLYHADDTIAALAIDTDNNANTGGGEWSGLGIRSQGWEILKSFTQGDPATNLIVGRLPLPAGNRWRLQAVLAQKDGTVMNVAFRGPREEAKADGLNNQVLPGSGNYWDDLQAAALSSGDISSFGETIDVADLSHGVTRTAPAITGFHQRVYTSQYTLPPGEGISLSGLPGRHGDTGSPCEQLFHYLGKYQPYGVYVPDTRGPHGLQLYMHGCSANHASQINQIGFQQQFGDALNRIIISPLGRGPTGFYSDISERDVLDVLADARATFDEDADRIFISGYSMGGYGTLRLGALYPDLFAGAVNWVGFTGNLFNTPIPGNPLPGIMDAGGEQTIGMTGRVGGIGNVIDLLGNFRHLPIASLYMGEDELVQINTSLAMQQRFESVEVPYQFYLHPVGEHLTLIALDDWQKEADYSASLVRVQNPPRVTYRTDSAFDYPEYGIRHDRAYWVSDIQAEAAGYSDVDLISLACGIPLPTFISGQDAGPAPLPWVATFRKHPDVTIQIAPVPEFKLSGHIVNVKALSIGTEATCLKNRSFSYDIQSDVPAVLRLDDGRSITLKAGNNTGNR